MVCNIKGWVVFYLVSYRVDDIDMLSGRSDYLCERLCCMVIVASDLQACGAFVWLTVCRLFSRLKLIFVSLKHQCLGFESGAYVAGFLFGCVSSFWYRGGYLVSAVRALLVALGESGQLVSGCRVREASNSCSLWQWYWRCAYRAVVLFCLVGYPL